VTHMAGPTDMVDVIAAVCPSVELGVDGLGHTCADVSAEQWRLVHTALSDAGAVLDWLCAIDLSADLTRLPGDPATGSAAVVAAVRIDSGLVLVRTTVADGGDLSSIADVYAVADWYEREAAEMVGLQFTGGVRRPLLLPDGFVGHPLRRDFPLPARLQTAWPGAAQAGRRARVPGVNPQWVDEQ